MIVPILCKLEKDDEYYYSNIKNEVRCTLNIKTQETIDIATGYWPYLKHFGTDRI
jgi:hypothetical protein